MAWLQANAVMVVGSLIIAWMLWQRLLAPRLAGVKAMDASAYREVRGTPHSLIDVRSKTEWSSGHPTAARHIPLGDFAAYMATIPHEKPAVLICASGMRSASAAAKLAKYGHPEVYNFSGGLGAWQAAGLPVKR